LKLLQAKAKALSAQREDEAAMADAVAIRHARLHRHHQIRLARRHAADRHAEAGGGAILGPHRLRAGLRQGLWSHSGAPWKRAGRFCWNAATPSA
jgi:hypothetical protein